MAEKTSVALKNNVLNTVKTEFNLSFLYLYSGPVPATAEEALDVVTLHTELSKISNNDTATGLTFQTPAAGVLAKTAAEVWSDTPAFSGVNAATSPQAPTFYRLCAAGDDGRGVANSSTGYRIQGTVGGPSTGADMEINPATITSGVLRTVGAYSQSITN